MKYRGEVIQNIQVENFEVTVNEKTLTLKLGILPLSTHLLLTSILPPPKAPEDKEYARTQDGEYKKHPVTGKPYKRLLTETPDFLAAQAEYGALISIYMVYCSLKSADSNQLLFEIEEQYKEKIHDKAFILAIEREFLNAGFQLSDLLQMSGIVQRLNSFGSFNEVLASDFSVKPKEVQTQNLSNSSSQKPMEETKSGGSSGLVNSLE